MNKDSSVMPTTTTGESLMIKEFAPVRWAVPGILPEGVTLFGGREKMGKSWLALGLCIAVATGGYALGKKQVEQGESLYLSLEDNERRLQKRLRILLEDDYKGLENLHYATNWLRSDNGGIDHLDLWLSQHPDTRLVVIDTLKRIRPTSNGKRSMYEVDYEAIQPFVDLAYAHNTAIVIVHHLNQRDDHTDPYDAFSGSSGLTAAVESVMILSRQRGNADAALLVEGKDIEDGGEYALNWSPEACTWSVAGDVEYIGMTLERRRIQDALPDYGEAGMGPKDISEIVGMEYENVRSLIGKMFSDGQASKPSYGKYTKPADGNGGHHTGYTDHTTIKV
jgi:hypothetical protein